MYVNDNVNPEHEAFEPDTFLLVQENQLDEWRAQMITAIETMQEKLSPGQFLLFGEGVSERLKELSEDNTLTSSGFSVIAINNWGDGEHCDDVFGLGVEGPIVSRGYSDTEYGNTGEMSAEDLLMFCRFMYQYNTPFTVEQECLPNDLQHYDPIENDN